MKIDIEVIFDASTIRTIGLDLPSANMPSVLTHNAKELRSIEFQPGFTDGYDVIWRFQNTSMERLQQLGEQLLALTKHYINDRVNDDPFLEWDDIIIELCLNYGDDVEYLTLDGASL